MATTHDYADLRDLGAGKRTTAQESFTATGTMAWTPFVDTVMVQVSGEATAVEIVLERSTIDPDTGDDDAVTVDTLTGDPSGGTVVDGFGLAGPFLYDEPGRAWWRARVTSLTGSPVRVAVSGRTGG